MLFTYKPINHGMLQIHSFIRYIFGKVWAKAPGCEYSIELFRKSPNLFAIMEELNREDQAGKVNGAGAFFYKHVNEIFNEFKSYSPAEILNIRTMFLTNNRIRALCDGQLTPFVYPLAVREPLQSKIKDFFSELYRSGFFNLKVVKDAIGTDLNEHYKAFAKANELTACPFCGLQLMDSEHDETREAYDHYLPSSKYPFNSVNFRNLAPACHKCNSQNKGAKDPLESKSGVRRKAFYPYNSVNYGILVSVRFLRGKKAPSSQDEVEILLSSPGHDEEVETWDQLLNIRTRYGAKCSTTAISKVWLDRVLHEGPNYARSVEQMLEAELKTCSTSPWIDASFLKEAYLREADRVGLLGEMATQDTPP